MRIVIVEDEPKTREGLIHIISKHTSHIIEGTAEDGQAGLALIHKLKPDLIISDIKMPVMDGLSMLEAVKAGGMDIQALLLTGYSEFEYARKALQLGVAEYVLKPLAADEFLNTLKEVEGRLQKRKVERASVSQLIWSCLYGQEKDKEDTLALLKRTLQVNEKMQTSLFLIRPLSIANETVTEMLEQIQLRLEALCIENYYTIILSREQGFLVMITDTQRNRRLRDIIEARVLKPLLDISLWVCSYMVIYDFAGLDGVLRKMRSLLDASFSFPEGTIIDQSMVEGLHYEEIPYPDFLAQMMFREIRNGNSEKIKKIGEQFKETIIESSGEPACIREYTSRFAAEILRVAREIKDNRLKEDGMEYAVVGIAKSTTRKEICYQLDKIISAIARKDESVITENGMILNVIGFIRDNYQSDVTLSEAAAMCGVTPEYLSRIFYKETGVNFSSFVQNFRISMAKRLLLSGNYKVYEVSRQVGFHDQKYFVKVFRKLCGVTPSEYKRENMP